jgi:hypothetical protein
MKKLLVALLAVIATASAALAQDRKSYSQAELDQMLAPIALYPDALLSQVLMASTYPLDLVEAARWTRTNPGLQGDEAVNQIAGEDWDPSVKSLVAFPNLLQRMDENLAWTRSLGEAFLDQEPHVMETVQRLRRKAQAAGHLLPDERLRVADESGVIVIEPAHPQVVYVPYYDPLVVYGAWWWPHYQPVVWAPWPSHAIGVTAGFFFGGIDWHHRHVKVVHVRNHYVRPLHGRVFRPLHVGKWQHRPVQRRELQRRQERPAQFVPRARPMPPALSASPPPRRAEQPRRVEQPRRMEQPRVIEQPRRVEQPRVIEQPRAVQAPRARPQPQPGLASSQSARGAPRAVPYDRGHGRFGKPVDRADGVGRVRANPAQHRAAQPDRVARHPGRDAGAVSVRPPVRLGVAGDRPRMAR